ncbi:uncharacterized protein LOC115756529 [Rhodamnia argentea]|uniref:Uncharacterized protein LOC115756529 n=1 Tax=Rhodamnia argentea TaxID=178133 RepID=A0A8B8QYB5_9MYRT|nr:uncharacterized protein LOC115756529 [Rhodamnia argentea]
MEMEEAEGSFPFPTYEGAYYVQSPSTVSHAYYSNHERLSTSFLSHPNPTQQAISSSTYALSRHSSRLSNDASALLPQNVNDPDPMVSDDGEKCLIGFGGDMGGHDDEEEDVFYQEKVEWWRYLSFGLYPSSNSWILLQLSWRMMMSLGVALLVFYLATKPPNPNVSVKVDGIPNFALGEGVDNTGVSTKILTCNISMRLWVDNKSKLFDLHIQPPIIHLYFGRLPLAIALHGGELYAGSGETTTFGMYVGTRNKAMYGAGGSMQDMLEGSKGGLALRVGVRLRSNIHVVEGLVHVQFHHQAHCLVLLSKADDAQTFHSNCTLVPPTAS